MPRLKDRQPDDPRELQEFIERICLESTSQKVKDALEKYPTPQRDVGLRPGKTLELQFLTKKTAALLQRRGAIATQACTSCQQGLGPFVHCVVADGFMKDSCANCFYEKESRCNFQKSKPGTT